MLRHMMSATDIVFMRSFMRHRLTSPLPASAPASSSAVSLASWRSSQKNAGSR
jgi:hypothetical protein